MSTTPPGGDARVVAERISYARPDGRALFTDLTLSLGRERTGLVGPNGSGKSTLVHLLAGTLTPGSGSVRRAGAVAVLPQGFRPAPGRTLATLLGVAPRLAALRRLEAGEGTPADLDLVGDDGWDLPERVGTALARFGLGHLPLDRPLDAMSGGEATRVALAGLVLGPPAYLLLDEPTNHLDARSRTALHAFVEASTGGLLCVSHDRALLRRMDRIVELSEGRARLFGGRYDEFRASREADEDAAERELERARAALRRAEREAREVLERQARREAKGRRDRAGANLPRILLNGRADQASRTTGRLRAVVEREVEERRERTAAARERVEARERPRFDLPSTGLPSGRTVLEMEGVTVRFPGAERPALEAVSLRIVGPERVALTGPNGSGKSTLLAVARGRIDPGAGRVRRLPAGEVGFLDQHGLLLDPGATVLDAFRARHPGTDPTAVRYALARFLFADEAALRPVKALSGGERLRASLACVLGGPRPPSLLVLDEPTNHLDLDATEALESALRGYDGALLIASHDPDFLDAVGVERRVALEGGCLPETPPRG